MHGVIAGVEVPCVPIVSHLLPQQFRIVLMCAQEWNGIPGQWWFGGGTDITPSYVNEEDMKHFHGTYKVCS